MASFGSDYQALAHHWVHNRDESHCYGGRMFSEGNAIYSYGRHFRIAQYIKMKNGSEIALVNSGGYSDTTRKQIGCVEYAIPNYHTTFTVPNATLNHLENIKHYIDLIEHNIEKSLRAIKYKDEYIVDAIKEQMILRKYVDLFRVKSKLTSKQKKVLYRNLADKDYLDRALVKSEKLKKQRKETKRLANKRAVRTEKKHLDAWMKCEKKYINMTYDTKVYLRFNEAKALVETSKSASMSALNARLLYKTIKAGEEIEGKEFDGYRVAYNSKKLTIGCHVIELDEIERLAKELGW